MVRASMGNPSVHTYRLQPRLRVARLTLAAVALATGVVLGVLPWVTPLVDPRVHPPAPIPLVVGVLLAVPVPFVLLALVLAWIVGRVRLVVAPDGIDYRQPGMRLTATWDNVVGVGRVGVGEGLILHDSGLTRGWIGRLSRVDGSDRRIPLFLFATDWRDGPLGEEIRSYAPCALPPSGSIREW